MFKSYSNFAERVGLPIALLEKGLRLQPGQPALCFVYD